jgi:hypothetical protein
LIGSAIEQYDPCDDSKGKECAKIPLCKAKLTPKEHLKERHRTLLAIDPCNQELREEANGDKEFGKREALVGVFAIEEEGKQSQEYSGESIEECHHIEFGGVGEDTAVLSLKQIGGPQEYGEVN